MIAFRYAMPLIVISVVLAVVFARRSSTQTPAENQTRGAGNTDAAAASRATTIVVVVVVVFAVLWLPQMVQ